MMVKTTLLQFYGLVHRTLKNEIIWQQKKSLIFKEKRDENPKKAKNKIKFANLSSKNKFVRKEGFLRLEKSSFWVEYNLFLLQEYVCWLLQRI